MTSHGDTNADREILSVTEDMLLSEEEVERLVRETPEPFALSEAVLRFEEPAAVGEDPEAATTVRTPVRGPVNAVPARAGKRKRLPARTKRASPARWFFLATVLACAVAAGIWFSMPPPAPPSAKSLTAKVSESAGALPASLPAPAEAVAAAVPAEPVPGVLVSEFFDYPVRSELKGRSSGTGWSGPWAGPRAVIAASSLAAGETDAAGAGGHLSLTSNEEITLTRPYAPASGFLDTKTGGEWWISLLVSHSGDDGEFWINCFSATTISAVVRLTLSGKGPALQLSGTGSRTAVTIPGAAGTAVRMVARVRIVPSGREIFDGVMDVWINPAKAGVSANPDLSLPVKNAVMPGSPGFSVKKLPQKTPGTLRLDGVVIARSAAGVMP